MIDAVALIGSRHPGETVTAVTHAVMIRLLLVRLTGIEDERWRRPVGRGSVTEFHLQNGTIRLAEPLPAGVAAEEEVGRPTPGTVPG
jgi:broad specificity phosphatase PhoE